MAALPLPIDASDGLAMAIVVSSSAPMLLLDGDLKILAASASFCIAFDFDPVAVQGMSISDLGAGEWNLPQLQSLLRLTASGDAAVDAYEIDLAHGSEPVRRLVLNAQKLNFAGATRVHILLSVSDVTDARIAEKIKGDLVRDKAVLLQELQHRIANSLQIIASVLMQSARRVRSDETRGYLQDAHHRIMSVASLQRQLATTSQGDVELRSYFTDLCSSIGASMIRDHNKVSLDVEVDDSSVSADVSVSLGLIVTELVINALKHAFPDGRDGKILVGYHTTGGAWTLSVRDDGVGMSHEQREPKPGLGTSIVEALASQLGGKVAVVSSPQGTEVVIARNDVTPELTQAA